LHQLDPIIKNEWQEPPMKKLFALLVLLSSHSVMALDDRREGFMVDLGIGLSNIEFSSEGYGYSDSDSDSGYAASIKVGYGLSDEFQLYYVRNATWTEFDGEIFVDGISGVGTNVFLSEMVFVSAAIGIGDFGQATGETDYDQGSAYMVGLGIEPIPHHNFQLNFVNVSITDAFNSGEDYQSDALQFLYSYSFY
jgi:hypothetical protein